MEQEQARILVVDDDPMIRGFCQELLQDEGYEVLAARNGQEAVDKARQLAPSIVLMDITMPVLDGIDACIMLKDDPDTAAIPVALMSAASNLTQQNRTRARADATLTKPFDIDHLLSTVERLIARQYQLPGTEYQAPSSA